MAWEDGMKGVYRVDAKASTGVKRTHKLMDSEQDTPALVEGLEERTEQAAKVLVLTSRRTYMDPSMNRAKAFLGISNTLDAVLDDDLPARPSSSALCLQATGTSMPAPTKSETATVPPTPAPAGPAISHDDEPSFFDVLRAPAKQATKSAATPKAPPPAVKAKAKPKAGEKSKRKKESRVEDMIPVSEPSPKDGGDHASTANSSTRQASQMREQDIEFYEDSKRNLLELMNTSKFRSAETEYKSDTAERQKEINIFLGKIRARRRMVKRRSEDNRSPALEELADLEDQALALTLLLKNLVKSTPASGDECRGKVETLVDFGGHLGEEVLKRVCRNLWSDDLKLMKWSNMVGDTYHFVEQHLPETRSFRPDRFLLQQMTVVLQKLLKGISLEKVSCHGSGPVSCNLFELCIHLG